MMMIKMNIFWGFFFHVFIVGISQETYLRFSVIILCLHVIIFWL